MKLALAAVCVMAMSIVALRPAAACSPAPTCGDDFCRGETAVIEGVVQQVMDANSETTSVTLQLTGVYGDAAELTVGQIQLVRAPWLFVGGEQGASVVLLATRDSTGNLSADQRLDLTDYRVNECFGSDATAASIATVALDPSCTTILDPTPVRASGCPSGPTITCSATGSPSGWMWFVGVLALVLRRRHRAR
jgi:uncharacterized protein (TIGR03382 family)